MRRGVSRWRAHPRWWTRSAVAAAVAGLVLLVVGQLVVSRVDQTQGAAARGRVEQHAETVSQATALAEARRSGAPAVSSAYQLIIDQQLPPSERQTTFSRTVPVRSDAGHLGWVLMGLRGQDFLGSVLEEAAEGVVHVDTSTPPTSPAAPTGVASSGPAAAQPDLTVPKVFDPFARSPEVEDSYPGTGLGLAICRRVVEAHGGRLTVVANPGGGSVFVVDLPVPSLVLAKGDGPTSARAT